MGESVLELCEYCFGFSEDSIEECLELRIFSEDEFCDDLIRSEVAYNGNNKVNEMRNI